MRLSVFLPFSLAVAVASFWFGHEANSYRPDISPRPASLASPNARGAFQPEMVEVVLTPQGGVQRQLSVSRYEVTFADWQRCVDAGGCSLQPKMGRYAQGNHPVSGVSWLDVQQYLSWISQSTGQVFRLPLESEWRELAAGVLEKEVKKLFDDPRLAWAADYANFGKRAERRTYPAGHYGLEDNGVADLAGNVWEWTQTCWRNPNEKTDAETVNDCGGMRVLAGAHMTYQSELVRVVPTGGCSIGFPPANIGFRLVLDTPVAVSSDEGVRPRRSQS